MNYLDKFKTVKFGGFRKEDVLQFIEQLVANNEQKCKDLQNKLDAATEKSQDKDKHIKELQTKLRQCIVQLQKSKNSIKSMEENHQTIIDEKNALLEETELSNRQLSYKIRILEEKMNRFGNLEKEKQDLVSKAEKISRDKTNQMIFEAKQMVEEEYNQRLNKANQDAESILRNAEQNAMDIIDKSKLELRKITEQAESQSQAILEKASITAKTIITEAAEKKIQSAYDKKPDNSRISMAEFEKDLENLRQNLQNDVKEVILHLDQATASVETAKIKAERIPKVNVESPITKETTKYKRAVKKFLK